VLKFTNAQSTFQFFIKRYYGKLKMQIDPRTQPLRNWNELARENAENAIVSSMFEAGSKATEPIETFSTWILVATAAVASFLITNADKLIPFITKNGFLTCGIFLFASCVFGFISKIFAVRAKINSEVQASVLKTFTAQLEIFNQEAAKIQAGAKFWGITLESGIRMDRILSEFMKPFPFWVRWIAKRHFTKYAGDPQIGHILQVKTLNRQGFSAFLQAVCFIGFLGAGFYFAATIPT